MNRKDLIEKVCATILSFLCLLLKIFVSENIASIIGLVGLLSLLAYYIISAITKQKSKNRSLPFIIFLFFGISICIYVIFI